MLAMTNGTIPSQEDINKKKKKARNILQKKSSPQHVRPSGITKKGSTNKANPKALTG